MSTAGSQGPNALGPQYGGVGGGGGFQPLTPTPTPTPSSTVHDEYPPHHDVKTSSASGLPPFSSFNAEMAADGQAQYTTLGGEHAPWDYYGEGLTGRLMDRPDLHPMHQPNYRPWETPGKNMEPGHPDKPPGHINGGFGDPFPASKLPSFQSQFNAFNEQVGPNGETVTSLTPLTPAPSSPSSSSSGLPSFHTLSTVNPTVPVPVSVPRGYPLVPAPVQAREVPAIQQQLMDERHIHLAFGTVPPHQLQPQFHPHHPALLSGHPSGPTMLTMVKSEPVTLVTSTPQLTQLHHTNFQNPMNIMDGSKCEENGLSKLEDMNGLRGLDSRKKERRKVRASSLESSAESDGAGSSSLESSGQVAAVSSTAGFKSPMQVSGAPPSQGPGSDDGESSSGEKPVKKKRKRCGECIGCSRKDNCGDCAPCRNEKSHQICKMRRCEKLTEKKGYRNKARQSSGPQTPQPVSQPGSQPQTPQTPQTPQNNVHGDPPMITNVSEQPVSANGDKLIHHYQQQQQQQQQQHHQLHQQHPLHFQQGLPPDSGLPPGHSVIVVNGGPAHYAVHPVNGIPMAGIGVPPGQAPVGDSHNGALYWANWLHQ